MVVIELVNIVKNLKVYWVMRARSIVMGEDVMSSPMLLHNIMYFCITDVFVGL